LKFESWESVFNFTCWEREERLVLFESDFTLFLYLLLLNIFCLFVCHPCGLIGLGQVTNLAL
jgi:hypothetical protein